MTSLRQRIRPVWLLAAASVVAAASLGVYEWGKPPVAQITATQPSRADMESSVSANGTVVPTEEFIARASSGGTVQQLLVHDGDHVSPGQLLVVMKDPYAPGRLTAAHATLLSTRVTADAVEHGGTQEDRIVMSGDRQRMQQDLDAARRNLATMQLLLREGGATNAEVRAAQARVDAASASLQTLQQRMTRRYTPTDIASWKARVADAQQAVRAEHENLASVRITSPIAGTAYLVPVRAYDFVAPGAELVHVADLHRIEIHASFDEPDIGKLHVGEPVSITWEGKPDHAWHGQVQQAPLGASHNGSRTVGYSIITVNDATGDLPPNINVRVTVLAESRRQVLTIPREALHIDGPERFVYRIVDGRLVRTPVRTGLVTLDRAEIQDGITPSDRIALHRLDNQDLAPGTKVEIVR